MSAHPICRLGDLVEVKGGKRLPLGTAYAGQPTKHPYIRVVDVENNSIRRDRLEYISEETHRQVARYTISSDDVFISIAGSIGLIATIPAELSGANLTENAAKLVIKDRGRLDRDYLARYLATAGQTEIQQRAFATGQPKLALFRIEEIPISLPQLSEQRRIADILDKADAIRRKRKEAIALTEELLRSAFLEMFGDPVTNPKGWEVKPLGEVAEVNRGKFSPRPRNDPRFYGGDFPFIQTGDLRNCIGYLRAWKQTLNEEGCAVSRGFARGTVAIAIAANIGDTAIVDFDFFCPDSVVGIVPNANVTSPEYIEMMLRFFQPKLIAEAPETAQKNINLETLRPLVVPLPPQGQQQAFAAIYKKTYAIAARFDGGLVEANNLFDSLVHRAFRGELTSPVAEQA